MNVVDTCAPKYMLKYFRSNYYIVFGIVVADVFDDMKWKEYEHAYDKLLYRKLHVLENDPNTVLFSRVWSNIHLCRAKI